jgi:hypothetical protein
MFSDFTADGTGAGKALELAIAALHKRVRRLVAPSGLRVKTSAGKATDLPAGISGPTLRDLDKRGKTPYYCYQVSVPIFGKGSTNKAFYIGTEKTANATRRDAALAKAINFRDEAVKKYETAATKAKRAATAELLAARQPAL